MTTLFDAQWICVNDNFDSEISGFTGFPPGRKDAVCIRDSESEKSRSDISKTVFVHG